MLTIIRERVYTKSLGTLHPTHYQVRWNATQSGYSVLFDGTVISSRHATENMALSWLLENRF